MQIPVERLVEIIVRQVLAELKKHSVVVGSTAAVNVVAPPPAVQPSHVEIDMSGYRTPVLTENCVRSQERHVREILVPAGTVCTIGARDAMQQRRMKLTYTGNKP